MEIAKMCLFLKELRKEKGLTQEQAAEQLFVTPKTLSRWETGRTIPDLETVLRLADFYEVDIKDLLSGERAPESEMPEGEGAGAAGDCRRRARNSLFSPLRHPCLSLCRRSTAKQRQL